MVIHASSPAYDVRKSLIFWAFWDFVSVWNFTDFSEIIFAVFLVILESWKLYTKLRRQFECQALTIKLQSQS